MALRGPGALGEGRAITRPLPPTPEQRSVTLQFDDNALLPLLYGEHDRHLARIEQRLGVRLGSRGNRLTIAGTAERTEVAEAALRALWRRLEKGQGVTTADVEAALRMAEGEAENDPRLPLQDRPEIRTRKAAIAPRSPAQAGYIEMLARQEMVFGVGPAGTGKTYLAVAQGVALLQAGRVDRIVLSRPAVEAGERLGFLPGDMKEKVDPYLRPLYDALHDMLPAEQVARRIASGEIEIAPLAFMRGRTLAHCYAILDEAQNTTPAQMKMFLTRMGEGSRMVITGDPTQVDLPNGQQSGLSEALRILDGVPGIAVARFDERDVVRHPLVARIVAAYGRADTASAYGRADGSAEAQGRRGKKEQDGTGK
ncbi:PhoH family protein [Paracraurococcus ruber]|uniref:PhoH-like protein n=1 Tax=Paracraurococcus ruber TaxID=77675 RepID=A0ABS1D482_9PROT|nr:phosphate starvation-inducible protein PhoH [Paracraurococcus ruber]TDG28266.1 PhoH family protein [Paracraurococcus ruber]